LNGKLSLYMYLLQFRIKRKTIQANVSQIADVGATNDEYN